MAKKRNGRQDAIRDIVRNKDVRTQRVLVDELRAMGFDCTQATVSRDIADMGLRKLPEGIYVLAEDLHLQRMVSELVTGVLRTDNLVMIKAQPGTASGIAAAVDAAELPDVLGSLAGNDTILVIAQTAEDGERLEALINKLSNSRKWACGSCARHCVRDMVACKGVSTLVGTPYIVCRYKDRSPGRFKLKGPRAV